MPSAVIVAHTWIAGELGNLEPWLDDHGFTKVRQVREESMDFEGADLVILLGSPWSVATGHATEAGEREIDAVRSHVDRGGPLLGICYGSQVLATALGGSVRRQERPFSGYVSIEATEDAVSGPWMAWHNDAITAPRSADVLGRLPHADLMFRQGRAWGVQPHIEVDAEIMERMGIALGASEDVYGPLVQGLADDAEGHRARARALLDTFADQALT